MNEDFIEAALSDAARARDLLSRNPAISGGSFHAALVAGDLPRVRQELLANPESVRASAGPRQWQPLPYVCFSTFANRNSERSAHLTETARELLRAGADPNTSQMLPSWPANPLPCLYAAAGLNNNPALTLALLEAGANPNDSESVYHSTEHADLECLRLLLQNGASLTSTNALKHMLDREDLTGLQLLLKAGADPNELNESASNALHWAVARNRSPAIVTALLESGVSIDAKRRDGRTAYSMAVQSGQREIADLLASRGADTTLSEIDRFLADCASADPLQLEALLANAPRIAFAPGTAHLLSDLTSARQTNAVRALLAMGFPIGAPGQLGASALHWACWRGYPELVELLIDHGASLTLEDPTYHATPTGWLDHGRANCNESGSDYPGVARVLRAHSSLAAN